MRAATRRRGAFGFHCAGRGGGGVAEGAARRVAVAGRHQPGVSRDSAEGWRGSRVPPAGQDDRGGPRATLVDFDDADRNDWLVLNQFTVVEAGHNRRPDIVVFVNGLPLAILELKNAADEAATIWHAYAQLQTYKSEVPSLLRYNELLVISDGLQARVRSLTSNQEWFKVWRTMTGKDGLPRGPNSLVLGRKSSSAQFLDLCGAPIALEVDHDGELAGSRRGYHQFHADQYRGSRAVDQASGMRTFEADRNAERQARAGDELRDGDSADRRAGVVWHTRKRQSFSILFAGSRDPQQRCVIRRSFCSPIAMTWTTSCSAVPAYHECSAKPHASGHAQKRSGNCFRLPAGSSSRPCRNSCPKGSGAWATLTNRPSIIVIAGKDITSQYDLIDGTWPQLQGALPNACSSVHRGFHRKDRCQHTGRVRRVHQRVRHPARPSPTTPPCRSTTKPHRQAR
ncbi:MAG: type I restriction endonuclease [Pirellulales bacterium]